MTATATPAVRPTTPITWIPTPIGRLHVALHRHALLRGTGFDVAPLHRLGTRHDPADPTQALENSLSVLRAAFRVPQLRAAVAQSNPGFHDLAFAAGRPLVTDVRYAELVKRGRQQVRTAHRYLRRLLGKTETNAFFGPTLVVAWDPDVAEPVRVGEPAAVRTVTGLSHWVVDELAVRHWRTQPAGRRHLRRDPLWRLELDVLHNALNDRRIRLTPPAVAVWQELATTASPAELAHRTGLAAGQVGGALTLLAPALRPWPTPPSTLTDGVTWLTGNSIAPQFVARAGALLREAATADWPAAHRARAELRDEVAAAGLRTGRSGGQHYADRDVVNEDRSSPWTGRVRLGESALRSVQRALAGLVPPMLLYALLRQADARQAVALATGGVAASLVELAAAEITPVTDRADRFTAALARLVPDDPAGAEVRLDAADLAAVLDPLWELVELRSDDQLAAVPGFDLMSAGGPPGVGRWVLSECHDDSSSAIGGITSRVQPGQDFDTFQANVSDWLDTSRMATVVGRRRSRHITPELPGLSVELSGVSGKAREWVAAAADVTVTGDGARLVHAGQHYQLYPGDVPGALFLALSLPCLVPVLWATDRPYTPRVVLPNGTVAQRRRWRLHTPAFGRDRDKWRRVATWRQAHGLPDQIFLRHPAEPKPLLVDFTDPLAVDDLTRLPTALVSCAEVLPELTDTWWDADGAQPCELRIPVFLRGETAGRPGVGGA